MGLLAFSCWNRRWLEDQGGSPAGHLSDVCWLLCLELQVRCGFRPASLRGREIRVELSLRKNEDSVMVIEQQQPPTCQEALCIGIENDVLHWQSATLSCKSAFFGLHAMRGAQGFWSVEDMMKSVTSRTATQTT